MTTLHKLALLHLIAFGGVFLFPAGIFAQETFVPLTSLPGLSDVESAGLVSGDTLPAFFNALYRLTIGVAAVLAIIQIIRAGIAFMTSEGSVSKNENAKSLLGNAILGILLVLSPVIVFSIINPDILKLDLNFEELQPTPKETSTTTPTAIGTCGDYTPQIIPGDKVCNTAKGYVSLATSCCRGISAGSLCCGAPKTKLAEQFKWRIMFQNAENGTGRAWREGGPFTDQQQCQASFEKFVKDNPSLTVADMEPACLCSSPVSTQAKCRTN
jgi:hypothetical protein